MPIHQNSKALNRIKHVTTGAFTSLLHAAYQWPEAIHAELHPATLKNYTNLKKSLPAVFKPGEKIRKKKLPNT